VRFNALADLFASDLNTILEEQQRALDRAEEDRASAEKFASMQAKIAMLEKAAQSAQQHQDSPAATGDVPVAAAASAPEPAPPAIAAGAPTFSIPATAPVDIGSPMPSLLRTRALSHIPPSVTASRSPVRWPSASAPRQEASSAVRPEAGGFSESDTLQITLLQMKLDSEERLAKMRYDSEVLVAREHSSAGRSLNSDASSHDATLVLADVLASQTPQSTVCTNHGWSTRTLEAFVIPVTTDGVFTHKIDELQVRRADPTKVFVKENEKKGVTLIEGERLIDSIIEHRASGTWVAELPSESMTTPAQRRRHINQRFDLVRLLDLTSFENCSKQAQDIILHRWYEMGMYSHYRDDIERTAYFDKQYIMKNHAPTAYAAVKGAMSYLPKGRPMMGAGADYLPPPPPPPSGDAAAEVEEATDQQPETAPATDADRPSKAQRVASRGVKLSTGNHTAAPRARDQTAKPQAASLSEALGRSGKAKVLKVDHVAPSGKPALAPGQASEETSNSRAKPPIASPTPTAAKASPPKPSAKRSTPSASAASAPTPAGSAAEGVKAAAAAAAAAAATARAERLARRTQAKQSVGATPSSEPQFVATLNGCRISVSRGDLVAAKLDAIVNAANGKMAHGAGLALAISTAGGPSIDEQSEAALKESGGTVAPAAHIVTTGGDMPCKHVYHLVGPRWNSAGDGAARCKAQLHDGIFNVLGAAGAAGASSIGVPAVSAGIFGGNPALCTATIVEAVLQHARLASGRRLSEIHLLAPDQAMVMRFVSALQCRVSADAATNNRHTATDGLSAERRAMLAFDAERERDRKQSAAPPKSPKPPRATTITMASIRTAREDDPPPLEAPLHRPRPRKADKKLNADAIHLTLLEKERQWDKIVAEEARERELAWEKFLNGKDADAVPGKTRRWMAEHSAFAASVEEQQRVAFEALAAKRDSYWQLEHVVIDGQKQRRYGIIREATIARRGIVDEYDDAVKALSIAADATRAGADPTEHPLASTEPGSFKAAMGGSLPEHIDISDDAITDRKRLDKMPRAAQDRWLLANRATLENGASMRIAYVVDQGFGVVVEGKVHRDTYVAKNRWSSSTRGASVLVDVEFGGPSVEEMKHTVVNGKVGKVRATIGHDDVLSLHMVSAAEEEEFGPGHQRHRELRAARAADAGIADTSDLDGGNVALHDYILLHGEANRVHEKAMSAIGRDVRPHSAVGDDLFTADFPAPSRLLFRSAKVDDVVLYWEASACGLEREFRIGIVLEVPEHGALLLRSRPAGAKERAAESSVGFAPAAGRRIASFQLRRPDTQTVRSEKQVNAAVIFGKSLPAAARTAYCALAVGDGVEYTLRHRTSGLTKSNAGVVPHVPNKGSVVVKIAAPDRDPDGQTDLEGQNEIK